MGELSGMQGQSVFGRKRDLAKAGNDDRLIDEMELAKRLSVSVGWASRARIRGGGPPFVKMNGAVRYRLGDVRAWIKENTHKTVGEWMSERVEKKRRAAK